MTPSTLYTTDIIRDRRLTNEYIHRQVYGEWKCTRRGLLSKCSSSPLFLNFVQIKSALSDVGETHEKAANPYPYIAKKLRNNLNALIN